MIKGPVINSDTCNECGLCVAVCPALIPISRDNGTGRMVEVNGERAASCMGCGHCMAICASESITVEGLSYERDFFDLNGSAVDGATFEKLLASRRSVRTFKSTPVPAEILERLVQMISMAPMGYTPHKIEITVVQQRETIEQALPVMVGMYEKLAQMMGHPVTRHFVGRKLTPGSLRALREHVLPSLKYRLPEMKAGQGDSITRGAPAMLLFHASPEKGGNHVEDAFIAVTYGLLSAHALGLGACAIGLAPPVVDRSPILREMFHIPPGNEVIACVILGYPKYRYRRGIRRELAGVNWV